MTWLCCNGLVTCPRCFPAIAPSDCWDRLENSTWPWLVCRKRLHKQAGSSGMDRSCHCVFPAIYWEWQLFSNLSQFKQKLRVSYDQHPLYVFQDTSCWRTFSLGSWSAARRPGSWWSRLWPTTLAGSVSTTFTARAATTVGWHTVRANWPTCCLPENWLVDSKVHRNTQNTAEPWQKHTTSAPYISAFWHTVCESKS